MCHMKAIHFYKDTTCKTKPPFLVVFNLFCFKQYMDRYPKVICKMQISTRLEFSLVCGKNIVENMTQDLLNSSSAILQCCHPMRMLTMKSKFLNKLRSEPWVNVLVCLVFLSLMKLQWTVDCFLWWHRSRDWFETVQHPHTCNMDLWLNVEQIN